MTEATRTGGCLCGRIRYRVPAEPLATAACHCRDCQRQAGSALSVIAVFPRAAFRLDGEPAMFEGTGEDGGTVHRYFCAGCGSPIYTSTRAMEERGLVAVKAGTLDEVGDLAPAVHYWTRSRQPWLPLPEGATCRTTG